MYIICDIGGTKTRVAKATEAGLASEPVIFPTEKDFVGELKLLTDTIAHMHTDDMLQSMVVGLPGVLSKDKSSLHNAPHLPNWNGKPLRDELAKACKAPVFLENDTALVGLGEAVYGAGKGQRIVGYLTISTGVGGVRIVDEDIDQAVYGFEPGHQFIALPNFQTGVPTCISCTLPGHLEAFIGGASLHQHHPPGRLRDVLTDEEKNKLAHYLAYGIHNILMLWSPSMVVLGGGLIVHAVIDLELVKEQVAKLNSIMPEVPPIVKEELRDVGGLYGGVAYIKKRLL